MEKQQSIIARNIKKNRVRLEISQDKLSKLADITLHTITKIESGATPDPRIVALKVSGTFISPIPSSLSHSGF